MELETEPVCSGGSGRSFRDALSYLETGIIGVLARHCLLMKVPSLDPQLSTAGAVSEKSQRLWVPAGCAPRSRCLSPLPEVT